MDPPRHAKEQPAAPSSAQTSPQGGLTRREGLLGAGVIGIAGPTGEASMERVFEPEPRESDLAAHVRRTKFVDTHEHLVEEESRTNWKPEPRIPCNDWGLLLSHYIDADLVVAGMPPADRNMLVSPDADTGAKWKALEPWWPRVANTGYGMAVRLALEALYGVRDLNATTIKTVAERYHATVKRGFYRHVLGEIAGIESCQVNSLQRTFMESSQPTLLMQDISILNLHTPEQCHANARESGIAVTCLADYHKVLDWWFATYGPYAVAAKSQVAYSRALDMEDVPPEKAAPPFADMLGGRRLEANERKTVEDHLFWYCVRKATEARLPVKLHTGYYAGCNSMPMARLAGNPGQITDLLRRAPDTTFVLMHICYPFHEEMVAIAKQWHNAVIDMCWSWIINPEASVRFLKSMLTAAPSNKVLTFGGDYIPVEPVVGHAMVARRGITLALSGLVADGWLSRSAAVELVEPIMRGNARTIFRLDEKERALAKAPWTGA